MYRITSENITELKENQIFVFGSNEAGRHGAGAAKLAMNKFGAKYGISEGLMGQSYAIPSLDKEFKKLNLNRLAMYVNIFMIHCLQDISNNEYHVTEIGCGLAGFKIEEIAPLFALFMNIENVWLPKRFVEQITGTKLVDKEEIFAATSDVSCDDIEELIKKG